jgi:hypothetical protein
VRISCKAMTLQCRGPKQVGAKALLVVAANVTWHSMDTIGMPTPRGGGGGAGLVAKTAACHASCWACKLPERSSVRIAASWASRWHEHVRRCYSCSAALEHCLLAGLVRQEATQQLDHAGGGTAAEATRQVGCTSAPAKQRCETFPPHDHQ